ncbi:hypothetical protein, partial [Gracilinema caldarium]|uniref:beta strand repeat-containing protein n=1 Tax=Gracilinema caldarium TaxID=215591 RepID=UPI0026F097FE
MMKDARVSKLLILIFWILAAPIISVMAQSQFPAGTASVGTSGNTDNGDRDGTVVFFFEIPDTGPSPIYFAINDPGITGTASLFDQNGTGTSYWYVLGGLGALSDPSSQKLTYSPYPSTEPLAGTLLWSQSWASGTGTGWNYTTAIPLNSGEHIGNKYYFKLVLQVTPGSTGKNAFQADVSSTNGSITAIAGAKSFAFSWSPVMSTNGSSGPEFNFYPFVPSNATGNITVNNWDIDNTTMITNSFFNKSGVLQGAPAIGGGSAIGSTNYSIGSEVNGSWRWQVQGQSGVTQNDLAEVWFTNGSTLLRTYSSFVGAQSADHIILTYNGGTLPVNGSGTVTVQAVDASGNPQLFSTKVWITTNSGTAMLTAASNTATSLPAAGALVVTDGNGLATVSITDSAAETVTVSALSDGTGGSDILASPASNNTVNLTFTSSAPTLTSASVSNITTAGNYTLPSITINANGGTVLQATNLYIRVPSSLSTVFNTGSTPAYSSSPAGKVSSVNFVNSSTLRLVLASDFSGTDTITINNNLQLSVSTNTVSSGSLELSFDGGSTYPVKDSLGSPSISINTAGTFTWSGGGANDNWTTAANWSGGVVPPANADVVIPTGMPRQPVINTAISPVNNITIESGMTLTTGAYGITINGSATVNGTINGGSGILVFAGNVIGTGTVTASSTNTYIGGNFTVSNFNANGGTLVLNGSVNQIVNGYGINHFNNIEINKSAGTVSLGSNWIVDGNLTITKGSLFANTSSITILGNLIRNSGTLAMGGNSLSVAGNVSYTAGSLTSTGTITLNGSSGAQSVNLTGGTIQNVTVENSFGTAPQVQMTNTAAFTWNGDLILTQGTLRLANFTQTIGGNVSGAGTLDASAITGANTLTVGGYIGTNGTPLETFSAPAGTSVSVGTNWNVTSFTHNGGTVIFTGTGTIYSGNTYNNLIFNSTGFFLVSTPLNINNNLTVTNSNGVTFQSTVTAPTVTLTNTTGTIDFQGAVTATSLTTAAQGYNVRFRNGGSITNAVTFSNTGSLTIDAGFTFTGGVTKTVGVKSLGGTIATGGGAGQNINLGTAGNITLTANTTLSSGSGAITLFDIPGPANCNLVLSGSGTNTLGAVNLGSGTLDLSGLTGGSTTVNGGLTAQALSTPAAAVNLAFNAGAGVQTSTITNAVTFSNTGTLTLGNAAGDSITFTGGVV